jgi:hypothetical protein
LPRLVQLLLRRLLLHLLMLLHLLLVQLHLLLGLLLSLPGGTPAQGCAYQRSHAGRT